MSLLSVAQIRKRFGGIVALDGVSFDLKAGEVHALCGENGAGKSTLIKILTGVHPHGSFEGEYLLDGEPARLHTHADAQQRGIGVIYQELVLCPELTVAENIFLGHEPRRGLFGLEKNTARSGRFEGFFGGLFIDRDAMRAAAQALLLRFGLGIDPDAPVRSLGVGEKQLVEIAKALSRNSRILILDEPTAALSEREALLLAERLRGLKESGVGILYVSHKLDEVLSLADRITVLRDGQNVLTAPRPELDSATLIHHMVGRSFESLFPERSRLAASRSPLLQISELSVAPRPSAPPRLRNISLTLHAGEIVGVAGQLGAGRTELLLHLFGAYGVRTAGTVQLLGEPLVDVGPQQTIARGLSLVSEERRRLGLFLGDSVRNNMTLSALRSFAPRGLIRSERETRASLDLLARLRLKMAGGLRLLAPVAGLSGGNQQKVVLGRALLTEPRVLLLDEPTRGIDVGARREIYDLIVELGAAGLGVLLATSELGELRALCDRVLVLRGGAPVALLPADAATEAALLHSMLGESTATAEARP